MKRLISFVMSICILTAVLSTSSFALGHFTYREALYYGCEADYSFITEEGRYNTLAFYKMSSHDFYTELVQKCDAAECASRYLNMLYDKAKENEPVYLDGFSIFYRSSEGVKDASDFPEAEGHKMVDEAPYGEGYRTIQFQDTKPADPEVYISVIKELSKRIGDDILWVMPHGSRTLTYVTAGPPDYGYSANSDWLGELNGDGRINLKDVNILLRRLAGWETDGDELNADFLYDGTVDMKDVAELIRFLSGWYGKQ